MKIRSARWIVVGALIGGLVTGGCSDGGDGGDAGEDGSGSEEPGETAETTAPVEADLVAYCEAELARETATAPAADGGTTQEERMEVLRTYGRETLRPLVDDVAAAAPEQMAPHVARLRAAVDELATSGRYSALTGDEVEAARDNLHAFDLDNCGWPTQSVRASDSAFGEVPPVLSEGPTSFELFNVGEGLHELVLVRKNEGVTASVEDLLAMPEEESRRLVTRVGAALADPGEQDYLVADLEPGEYIGACFVASGTASEDAEPAQGPPHVALGMVLEFSVG